MPSRAKCGSDITLILNRLEYPPDLVIAAKRHEDLVKHDFI